MEAIGERIDQIVKVFDVTVGSLSSLLWQRGVLQDLNKDI